MATKQEIIDKIQTIAKRVYSAKSSGKDTLGISPNDVDLDNEKFPVLSKFPNLKQVIINLLSEQYELFIDDVLWVAPRPTMFKIMLANGQFFYLTYTEKSWIAQVEGKKYYLSNINEEGRAAQAISRILMYGNPNPEAAEAITAVPPGEPDTEEKGGAKSPPPAEEQPEIPEEEPEATVPA
jgi:hypothetical protein